jgi:hypothetical protein
MRMMIKTKNAKKNINKKRLSQRGGSGRPSRGSSAGNNKYHKETLQLLDTLPPVPKHIPRFSIKVRVKDVEELIKIYKEASSLKELLADYIELHHNVELDKLEPEEIRRTLVKANETLNRYLKTLQDKYIYTSKKIRDDILLRADQWCDYIKKLIDLNKQNIAEIDEYLSIKNKYK